MLQYKKHGIAMQALALLLLTEQLEQPQYPLQCALTAASRYHGEPSKPQAAPAVLVQTNFLRCFSIAFPAASNKS